MASKQHDWTPESLQEAVTAGTLEQKIELMKKIGIILEDGSLAPKYKDWGDKPSRTPDSDD